GSTGSLLLKYVGLFDVSALISLTSLLFLFAIANPGKDSWPMFILCTVVVVVTNVLVAVQYRLRPGRAVLTAILATLVLLVSEESLAKKEDALSLRLVSQFGIGERGVTLFVKKEANDIFNGRPVPPRDGGKAGEADKSGAGDAAGVVVVKDARILSRLGKEYLVEVGGRRVAIPRDWVLSWSAPVPPLKPREAKILPKGHRANT
ncbi:MAG TPA: hypothetical protein VGX68_02185, partial [Thermoanaerobaculia bacterium]|nr:hypothetical protein [Thermoanaerobaculia bacterium]